MTKRNRTLTVLALAAVAEGFLLGNSTLGASQWVHLGRGYDVGVGAEDLAFKYRTDTGAILAGLVEYVSSAIPGDANSSGYVDDALHKGGGTGKERSDEE